MDKDLRKFSGYAHLYENHYITPWEVVEVVGSRVKTNVGWLENADEWILKK